MKTTQRTLDKFADKLRRCYQFERNQLARTLQRRDDYRVPACWSAGGSESRSSVWHKLANFCRARGLDAVRYVQWRLDLNVVLFNPPPEPNQLLSSARMGEYEAKLPALARDIIISLRGEKNTAETYFFHYRHRYKMPPTSAWVAVLSRGLIQPSPLFRYVIAYAIPDESCQQIAEDNLASALLQYHRHPAPYEDVFGRVGWLPDGFADYAERAYDWFLAQEP